jgi:hypothetical protein
LKNGVQGFGVTVMCRYRDMFDNLLARGMTPNVTLHHFTAPQWFMDIGGWAKAENIHIFVEYAVKVVWVLGMECSDFHHCLVAVQCSTARTRRQCSTVLLALAVQCSTAQYWQ